MGRSVAGKQAGASSQIIHSVANNVYDSPAMPGTQNVTGLVSDLCHDMVEEERSKKRRREPPSVISQRAAVTALSGPGRAE